jgi:HSP20 family protein
MMTLWRNPENGLAAFSAEVDRMVNRLALDAQAGWSGYGLIPTADVHETEADFKVVLDLPGLDAKSIDIHVENDTLAVKAERTQPKPAEGEAVHRTERAYGTFFRSFALPRAVDAARVEARYDAGVLTVVLPKREEAKPRTIPVQVR